MLLVSAVGIATVAPAEDAEAHLTAFGHWHYSPANGGSLADWQEYCEPFVIRGYDGWENANCYWPAYTTSGTRSYLGETWWRVSIRSQGYDDSTIRGYTDLIWQDGNNGRAGPTPTLPCTYAMPYPTGFPVSPCS